MTEGTTGAAAVPEVPAIGRKGRLKIFLGYAPGVGKTFRMLQEAQDLKKGGATVVIGFVETHNRPEVTALKAGLEEVPRKITEFHGLSVEELDLEAVVARRPTFVLIDEIAHTNLPGSTNLKRYQDVLSLTGRGIGVLCTFDIQNLESLAGPIERILDVPVRDSVPDTLLKEADQIVAVDIPVEDLLERFHAGKVSPRERPAGAREALFKAETLSSLRELALREIAESLDRKHRRKLSPQEGVKSPVPLKSRVMVCVTSGSPRARLLLHRGSRLAGRLDTHWFVVSVEPPGDAGESRDPDLDRRLMETLETGRELGAEIIRIKGSDPVDEILNFARSHGVSHIIIGRSHQPWWKQIFGWSPVLRLIREADGFDVHIVSFDSEVSER